MPVLKVKNNNNIWQDIATANSHAHTMSDISDLPPSIVNDVEALKDKVGAESVAYQVKVAMETLEGNAYKHPITHPASMITGLSNVATSGDYNDLSNKPTIPSQYEHPSTHPASMIEGLASVATSGSYNDLSNKPTIPSIAGLATKAYVDEQIASVGGSGGMTEQVQADWDETDTTSPAYIKNKPIISGEGGSSVQANWNQEDPNQADYIKNKPFGEYEGLVDILPSTQYNNFYLDSSFNVYGYSKLGASYSLTIGETYTVFWDGVEYTCIAQDASIVETGAIALGNCAPFGLAGNNEPFVVANINGMAEAYFALTDTQTGGSHTVRIAKSGMIAKQIDPKYIPIPFFGEGKGGTIELMPPTDLTFVFEESDGLYKYYGSPTNELFQSLTGNSEIVRVMWDGTEYICVGNVDMILNGTDNGIPFLIMLVKDMEVSPGYYEDFFVIMSFVDAPSDTSSEVLHNVSIEAEQISITTIDPKYIDNVSWEKISDKPFSETLAGTVIVDKAVDCSLQFSGDMYVAEIPELVIGDCSYNVELDGVAYELHANVNGEMVVITGPDYSFMIVYNYMGLNGLAASQGTHTLKITLAEDIVKTIDPKFIPKIDGLPEVTSDDNGKSLKVIDGVWSISDSLPSVTVEDVGKFLRVGSDGTWVVETVRNAEEVAF